MSVGVVYAKGLRKIRPYWTKRASFAKGRWLGRTLLDVLLKEFKVYGEEKYRLYISKGLFNITRASVKLPPNDVLFTKLENKDIIETRFHKHEPPVKQWCNDTIENNDTVDRVAGINVIYEDNDLFIIDKPSGIPVHPTGQFYQNTLTEIFKNHNKDIYPCYRLDKITSGLLIFAKNQIAAGNVQNKIRDRAMNKYYFARVNGKFPGIDLDKKNDDFKIETITRVDPIVEKSSLYTVELKKGRSAAFSSVKDAETHFYFVDYFPACNQSIVLCKPITGRTHQIRIHLARLGFPIVNDPFYNLAITKYKLRSTFIVENRDWTQMKETDIDKVFEQFIEEEKYQHNSSIGIQMIEECQECGIKLMNDPSRHELELYLHAWYYANEENTINYQTKNPTWIYDEE